MQASKSVTRQQQQHHTGSQVLEARGVRLPAASRTFRACPTTVVRLRRKPEKPTEEPDPCRRQAMWNHRLNLLMVAYEISGSSYFQAWASRERGKRAVLRRASQRLSPAHQQGSSALECWCYCTEKILPVLLH